MPSFRGRKCFQNLSPVKNYFKYWHNFFHPFNQNYLLTVYPILRNLITSESQMFKIIYNVIVNANVLTDIDFVTVPMRIHCCFSVTNLHDIWLITMQTYFYAIKRKLLKQTEIAKNYDSLEEYKS